MAKKKSDDGKFGKEETSRRFKAALLGARLTSPKSAKSKAKKKPAK